jgi:RimJ/RimL family protein N-acetyltransferase
VTCDRHIVSHHLVDMSTLDFDLLTRNLERVYSTRIALRRLSLCDAWPLYQATRNPQFNHYLLWKQPQDDSPVRSRVERIVAAADRGELTAVSAVAKDTGEWISLYRFLPFKARPDTMEMSIWTHERFWRDGYSLELTRMCIDAAFSCTDVGALVGATALGNRSNRILEGCGLTPGEITPRDSEFGEPVKVLEHTITRAQWQHDTASPPSFARFDLGSHTEFPTAAAPMPSPPKPISRLVGTARISRIDAHAVTGPTVSA